MHDPSSIFGCFVSVSTTYEQDKSHVRATLDRGEEFRAYVFGQSGITSQLKSLKHKKYGRDIKLILLKFFVNPLPEEIRALKEIEAYRRNEKAISISIVVTDKEFFSKDELSRTKFLKQLIQRKLDALEQVIKKKKLDTNMELLKRDVILLF